MPVLHARTNVSGVMDNHSGERSALPSSSNPTRYGHDTWLFLLGDFLLFFLSFFFFLLFPAPSDAAGMASPPFPTPPPGIGLGPKKNNKKTKSLNGALA